MLLKKTSAEGTRNKNKPSAELKAQEPSALALFLFHAPSALVCFLEKTCKEILKPPEKNYESRLVASLLC